MKRQAEGAGSKERPERKPATVWEVEAEACGSECSRGLGQSWQGQDTGSALTLISGAVLNCGGPLSRVPAALASLKLGVGELGGFTGSGTRRLGPPALFPEPGATPPAPAGAAALGSFLER